MWQSLVVVVVLLAWKVLSFADTYLPGRLADRLGKPAIVVIGAISLLAPNAFAAGTKQFVDAEAKAMTTWIQDSLRDVFHLPKAETPEDPPSPTPTNLLIEK